MWAMATRSCCGRRRHPSPCWWTAGTLASGAPDRTDGGSLRRTTCGRGEGIRELDLLVLTHLHLDHAGGLTHLLPGVRVREFWTNYLPPEEMWGHTLPAVPGAPAGARCLMTSMGIYVKALAHLRSQKTEIRLIRTPCDCRRLTETLSAGVFLEDEELRLRQASIWDAVLSGAGSSGDLEALDGFINNTSIRLRLSYAGQEIELPGGCVCLLLGAAPAPALHPHKAAPPWARGRLDIPTSGDAAATVRRYLGLG